MSHPLRRFVLPPGTNKYEPGSVHPGTPSPPYLRLKANPQSPKASPSQPNMSDVVHQTKIFPSRLNTDSVPSHWSQFSTMPVNLSIKNAPDHVVRQLRERAARHHRSLQGELLAIIEAAVAADGPSKPVFRQLYASPG